MDVSNKALMIKRLNMPHEPRHHFSPEKKIDVVTKYLALGNMRLVADLTGISYGLLRQWKIAPWWKDLEAEIKSSRDIETDNKLSKLVDKSLDTVKDRLENGNVRWDRKTGDVIRVPVNLLEAAKVADVMLTQQHLLAKKEQHEDQRQQAASIQDQIKMLAVEFAKFNTGRTIAVQAKEITDAVYDERETGLQEAVREVRREARPDQGSFGEESSTLGDDEGGAGSQGGWEGRGSHEAIEQGWEPDESLEPAGGEPDDQSFFFSQPERQS